MTQDQNDYFDKLGIDPEDRSPENISKLREAYERAHDIRKFEIEMYWRRSAYLWTLQAAALAGLAVVVGRLDFQLVSCNLFESSDSVDCIASKIKLVVVASIWLFGLFSAYVWLLLLCGAKYWQNNWERHLDVLENHFSGALYKTYPIEDMEAPYSVTKLNYLMAYFMIFLWFFIGTAVTCIYANGPNCITFLILILAVTGFLSWYFDDGLKMSDYPSQPGVKRRKDPCFTKQDYE